MAQTLSLTEKRAAFLVAAKRHRSADMLIKGTYVDTDATEFRGCSVGCMLRDIHPEMSLDELDFISERHKEVADHFGYPEWLAHLQDTVFEGLPNGEHQNWHVQLAEAVAKLPENFDWQITLHRVHAAILRVSYRNAGSAQDVVRSVLDLHERAINGTPVADEDWSAARSAAWSAAWSATESAARSAAWSAAESAAESAARSAAWSAAESAEWSAWSAAYQEIRDAVLSALADLEG